MNSPGGWTVRVTEEAAHVLKMMRAGGESELHDQLVRFLRALAIEAGAAIEADKPLPGLPMGGGDRRYNVDVHRLPVLISYTPEAELREIRITDLLWLG
ncbi:hypothetical protein [Streptomyces smyrnaeus]|uniref:Plasmid stabilization protein n=1 Tax=Streptomyces smyrnaeus TaxID=1387713 RepID=A0ABS3Y693_9ACTN|nr:hypothetical protein [Streptomyces smyrnaeus]MBO8203187.1 hypothetical protein [Streptomyces smyrnaeus]